MGGKTSRTKGHSFERYMANEFKKIGYPDAKRHLEYQIEEALGIDLDNTGEYVVQCKAYKKCPNPFKVLKEIKDNKKTKLAIIKQDRDGIICCLYWKDLKKMIKIL